MLRRFHFGLFSHNWMNQSINSHKVIRTLARNNESMSNGLGDTALFWIANISMIYTAIHM